jgi:hypothetical protein
MEITCKRCHRAVGAEDCYCPSCGLPQLVYSAEDAAAQGQPERWNEAVRDASTVLWKPAMRFVLMLAIPAGLLCSVLSPVSLLGLFWMAAAAAWAVLLYVRSQRMPWITLGAGARIGLVTGILGGWTAAAASGAALMVLRYPMHEGKQIDGSWQDAVTGQMSPKWAESGLDAHSIAAWQGFFLSPEGRAGVALLCVLLFIFALLMFAVAGGALGARLTVRARRPEV